MTSDPKKSKRSISSSISAFQKHTGWKKSKKVNFQTHFQVRPPWTRNGPKPKFTLHIPHSSCTSSISCTSILNPQSSILNPQSSILSFMVLLILNWPHCTTHVNFCDQFYVWRHVQCYVRKIQKKMTSFGFKLDFMSNLMSCPISCPVQQSTNSMHSGGDIAWIAGDT